MSVRIIPAQMAAPVILPENREKIKTRVAAYCRVSTDLEEQENSFESQVRHYTEYISANPTWSLAGIYADEGLSGTGTKKREQFNAMISDCENGKIDLVITKSISRFARNTLDCLNYIRKLKGLNIPILFEKENINTMDATGEIIRADSIQELRYGNRAKQAHFKGFPGILAFNPDLNSGPHGGDGSDLKGEIRGVVSHIVTTF